MKSYKPHSLRDFQSRHPPIWVCKVWDRMGLGRITRASDGLRAPVTEVCEPIECKLGLFSRPVCFRVSFRPSKTANFARRKNISRDNMKNGTGVPGKNGTIRRERTGRLGFRRAQLLVFPLKPV